MGQIMFMSGDKEFYGTYLSTRDVLLGAGWKEETPVRTKDKVSCVFTKNGYALYVLYGCEEDIRNEIL